MHTEDRYIINKCLNGDKAAFGLLVDKYKASIYALAYSKIGNFHDAEDISQEAFIKAYQNLHSLRRWDSFLAWLYSITSNLCRNWLDAHNRTPEHESIEDNGTALLDSLSIYSYQRNERDSAISESIHDALGSLPDIHSQVLTLFYLGGMSIREIARFLGTSPNTITQRLHKARSRMKEEMITMMSEAFQQKCLQAIFTLRIVEIVKRIKIHPVPRTSNIPWGLSLATGIIVVILGMGTYLNISNNGFYTSISSAIGESRVLNVGEYPVDVMKISDMPNISNQQDGDRVGTDIPNLQNALFMAPQAGDTWARKADMPTARLDFSTSVVNGKIYAIGGHDGEKGFFSTVEEYDPIANKWAGRDDMPTARWGLTTSVIDGKIYAIGGGTMRDVALSTVEEYDPAKNKWIRKNGMPEPRAYLSSCVVNGKIYAIGGRDLRNILPTVFEYDPMADIWTRKSDMPTARLWLSVSAVNDKVYAIGGSDNHGEFSTIEEYDPVTDKWTRKRDIPLAKGTISTTVLDGKIYAIQSNIVEEYDSLTDTWTRKADIPNRKMGSIH